MASTSGDSWMKEYNDATKLADDINGMISEKTAMSGSGPDSQRHFSAVRRKITILGTRLDSLESLLSKPPSKKSITGERVEPPQRHAFEFENKDKPDGNYFEHVKFCQQRQLTRPGVKAC